MDNTLPIKIITEEAATIRWNRKLQKVGYWFLGVLTLISTAEFLRQHLRPQIKRHYSSPVLTRLSRQYGYDAFNFGALETWLGDKVGEGPGMDDSVASYYMSRSHEFYRATKGVMSDQRKRFSALCPDEGVHINADKELGYNLEAYVGQAYFLHLVDCLNGTSGFAGTLPFFFFNPDHSVFKDNDTLGGLWVFDDSFNKYNAFALEWKALSAKERGEYWNPLRSQEYPSRGLIWPPYSDFYKNTFLEKLKDRSGKRIAIVNAKHYRQWGGAYAINTFSMPKDLVLILDSLLSNDYIVIYSRQHHGFKGDTATLSADDPGDFDLIKNKYADKDVIVMDDIWNVIRPGVHYEDNPLTFNVLQMLVFQQASIFVAPQGGGSVLTSLMPGDHFILHKMGSELITSVGRDDVDRSYVYNRWWRHGGGRFFVYSDVAALASELGAIARGHTALKDF